MSNLDLILPHTEASDFLGMFYFAMNHSTNVNRNVSDEELNQATIFLNKLTYFHDDIWIDDKNSSMNEIFMKYIK